MKFYKIFFTLAVLFVVSTSNARLHAEEQELYASQSDIPSVLLNYLRNSTYEEQYISQILGVIRQNATDNKTLTIDDVKAIEDRQVLDQRRRQVHRLLGYDQNFDANVSKEEIEEFFKLNKRYNEQDIEKQTANIMQADLNADGKLTMEEMVDFADQELAKRASRDSGRNNQIQELLAIDPNSDGKLTVEELKAIATKAYQTMDADGDGVISKEERSVIGELNRKRQELERLVSPECEFPKPEKDEKIVFIGVYEGKAVSTVSVAGQVSETNVIPVQIDKGDEKLYIITSAFSPVIWQFKGDTGRVSKLLLSGRSMAPGTDNNDLGGHKINVGATGIEANKITFSHARTCGLHSAYDKKEEKKQLTLTALEKLLGRKPDLYFSEYGVLGLHIFGERINSGISDDIKKSQKSPPEGFEPNLWNKHIRYMPGGVIDIKDEKVVSDASVEPYEVLPKWAGFAKLAYEGAIVPVDRGGNSSVVVSRPGGGSVTLNSVDNIRLGEDSPLISFEGSRAVKIVKDIPYYPSGLYGGYSAEIIIGKGVTPPKGTAGHSNIISEETGKPIGGPIMHLRQ